MNAEEKRSRFDLWRKELEARCDAHLRRHPENHDMNVGMKSRVIRVSESAVCPGAWCVWDGDVKLTTFHGPTARDEAYDMERRLLEN